MSPWTPLLRRLWPLAVLAGLALAAGCPSKEDDDDVADDDDDDTADDDTGDDDTGDDDTIPTEPCVDRPNAEDLDDTVCGAAAACRIAEVATGAYQGYALAGGGDFDGDGLEDLAVGAPGFDVGQDEGQVALYTLASVEQAVPAPVATLVGAIPLQAAGGALAFCDDLDGDGLDDLLVGARGDGTVEEGAGAVLVLHGRALAGDPAAPEALTADSTIRGEAMFSRAGTAVTGVTDFDGDGRGELAFGHELYQETGGNEYPFNGKVALFRGLPGMPAEALASDADLTFTAPATAGQLGYALDGRGDITGDGLGDLLVGAPEVNAGRGLLHVLTGATLAGLAAGEHEIDTLSVQVGGDEYGMNLAAAVRHLGDIDGDGLGDLALGAPDGDLTWEDGGVVVVLAGAAEIDAGTPPVPLATFGSEWDDFRFGGHLANAGDLDGDGLGDLLVGATWAYLGPIMKGGRAYLFHGREAGWDTLVDGTDADAGVAGIVPNDNLGQGLALSDLDGDGADELLVGAPFHEATGVYSGEVYLFWGPSR